MIPLLSISYLPPISYVSACVSTGEIVIEKHEHFVKQTHRNRALIYGANGLLPLIIPVQHIRLSEIPIEKVRVSDDIPWRKIHWRSLVSAYRNSAYFGYYEDDFGQVYHEQHPTLAGFNLALFNIVFRLLGGEVAVTFTDSYWKEVTELIDLRNAFDSAESIMQNTNTSENRYRQVFSSKHGFIPNLSIVDLLFNEGPKSIDYLARIS